MKYDPDRHHRQSMRLHGRDYCRAATYFVTICVQDRECLFGDVVAGEMRMNAAGQIIADEWRALITRFPSIELDAFVVMPNHVHGIVVLGAADASLVGAPLVGALPLADSCIAAPTQSRAATRAAPTRDIAPPTLGTVIGAFKSLTTLHYTRGVDAGSWPGFRNRLWQRSYHEEIIRNANAYAQICRYIAHNPAHWADDCEHPEASR